jgi:hypothetical protein
MGSGCIGLGMKLTIDLHLVQRLRMSGAVPLLPSHVFVTLAHIKYSNVTAAQCLLSLIGRSVGHVCLMESFQETNPAVEVGVA